ncbi:MAG: 5'-methylthioadenosine/S-adenosylhomocysteine nucleosidase [Salaquimonas sp.]
MKLKSICGKSVLYVMAAEPEYGPHLQKRISPLMTGIGPVEAAVQLSLALCRLSHEGMLPDLVVSLGSAGSAKLEQGSVHQVSSVSYRDMDASPLGFEKGCTPLLDLSEIVELTLRIPDIPSASISTGANIISGSAYEDIKADMVDMESFAILRSVMAFEIPMIGLRGISDGAKELSHLGDWTEYLHVVDERLAGAIDMLEQAIVAGSLI